MDFNGSFQLMLRILIFTLILFRAAISDAQFISDRGKNLVSAEVGFQSGFGHLTTNLAEVSNSDLSPQFGLCFRRLFFEDNRKYDLVLIKNTYFTFHVRYIPWYALRQDVYYEDPLNQTTIIRNDYRCRYFFINPPLGKMFEFSKKLTCSVGFGFMWGWYGATALVFNNQNQIIMESGVNKLHRSDKLMLVSFNPVIPEWKINSFSLCFDPSLGYTIRGSDIVRKKSRWTQTVGLSFGFSF